MHIIGKSSNIEVRLVRSRADGALSVMKKSLIQSVGALPPPSDPGAPIVLSSGCSDALRALLQAMLQRSPAERP